MGLLAQLFASLFGFLEKFLEERKEARIRKDAQNELIIEQRGKQDERVAVAQTIADDDDLGDQWLSPHPSPDDLP